MPSRSWSPTNRCEFPVHEPIRYIERTRKWYAALGFETPYEWAESRETPFTRLAKPLSEARVALITTAALYDPAKGEQGPGAPYNGGAKFYTPYAQSIDITADTRISHIAYDRTHTDATDQRSWFPLEALKAAAASGHIGTLAPRFHGAPTNRSQRVTREQDAPTILNALREDRAEAAILVPNCPVCHQTVTLISRHLEANGIATVIMACARDIVERAGAPRAVFSDFPLGNAAGKPNNTASQGATLALALELLETVETPGSVTNPQVWSDDHGWKLDYSNPDKLTAEELAERRLAFDQQKIAAKTNAS